MKKGILTILLFASTYAAFSQSKNTATVQKVRGIPCFVMSEPDAAYTRIGEVSDDDATSVMNALGGNNTYRSIKESCEVIINNAERKHKKGKIEDYDAIIISDDGHTGTCIKWK